MGPRRRERAAVVTRPTSLPSRCTVSPARAGAQSEPAQSLVHVPAAAVQASHYLLAHVAALGGGSVEAEQAGLMEQVVLVRHLEPDAISGHQDPHQAQQVAFDVHQR